MLEENNREKYVLKKKYIHQCFRKCIQCGCVWLSKFSVFVQNAF